MKNIKRLKKYLKLKSDRKVSKEVLQIQIGLMWKWIAIINGFALYYLAVDNSVYTIFGINVDMILWIIMLILDFRLLLITRQLYKDLFKIIEWK